jgi:hypothetical protein
MGRERRIQLGFNMPSASKRRGASTPGKNNLGTTKMGFFDTCRVLSSCIEMNTNVSEVFCETDQRNSPESGRIQQKSNSDCHGIVHQ